jgi:hypothetical protein
MPGSFLPAAGSGQFSIDFAAGLFHSNERVASLLVKRVLRMSVLLIICWSRGRRRMAPQRMICSCLNNPTDQPGQRK